MTIKKKLFTASLIIGVFVTSFVFLPENWKQTLLTSSFLGQEPIVSGLSVVETGDQFVTLLWYASTLNPSDYTIQYRISGDTTWQTHLHDTSYLSTTTEEETSTYFSTTDTSSPSTTELYQPTTTAESTYMISTTYPYDTTTTVEEATSVFTSTTDNYPASTTEVMSPSTTEIESSMSLSSTEVYPVSTTEAWTTIEYTSYTNMTEMRSRIEGLQNGVTYEFQILTRTGNASNIVTGTPIAPDTVPPSIVSISTAALTGSYTIGSTIPLIIRFSESVVSYGDITIQLDTGSVQRNCITNIRQLSRSATCTYTIQSGDTSTKLTAISVRGDIRDAAGNKMRVFTPKTNIESSKTIQLDTTAPVYTAFTYKKTHHGLTVTDLTLTATDNVGVTAYLLTHTSDTPARDDTRWSSIQPTSYQFPLETTSGTKTIYAWARDAAGNISKSANNALVIDNESPSIVSIGTESPDGAYKSGTIIPIVLSFSEPVTVVGMPYLEIETGVNDTRANYTRGNNTRELVFDYIVRDGDASSDLDIKSLVTTDNSYIYDGINKATTTLPTSPKNLASQKNIIVDTSRPATPQRLSVVNSPGIIQTNTGTLVDVADKREISLTTACLVGGTVTVYDDVRVLASSPCTSTPLNIPVQLTETENLYYVTSTITNTAGTSSYRSPGVTIIKKNSSRSDIPGTPDLISDYDLGTSNTDNITSDIGAKFSVACTSGTTVNLYNNAELIGTALCVAQTAKITPREKFTNGTYTLTAKQSTAVSSSSASNALTVKIDTTPLAVVIKRAKEQPETTPLSTIKFLAEFSRDINPKSFICNDIKAENSTCKSIQHISGNSYIIALDAKAPGKVSISIPEKQIQTIAGNGNSQSTGSSTVTYIALNAASSQSSQTVIHGQCGSIKNFYAANPTSTSLDEKKLCSRGSVVRVVYDVLGKKWSYTCRGENGGKNEVCTTALGQAFDAAPVETTNTCTVKKGASLPLDMCVMGNKGDMFQFHSYLSCLNVVAKKSSCREAGCTINAKRQEFVYIIDRVRGIPLGDTNYACQNLFKDTPKGWICEAAEKARIAGLISSKNTLFRGQDSLTRAEAYAMALTSVCITPDAASKNWQTNVINTAKKYNFTARTVGTFEPNRPISRGETYALAVNMIEWKAKNPEACPTLPENLICDV